MRVIAFITGVSAARAILAYLVEPKTAPRDHGARPSVLRSIV